MGRRWIAPLIILGLLGLLQATALHPLSFWGVRPDLILVAVVAWALARGMGEGLIWGFVGGLVTDFFSAAPFGAYTLVTAVIGALSGLGETNLFRANPLLTLLAMVLATLLYDLAGLAIVRPPGRLLALDPSIGRLLLLTTLLNLLAMFLLQQTAGILERAWGGGRGR